MLQVQTSEFKYHLPHYLQMVEQGETITLVYGKNKKQVAKVVPVKVYPKNKRTLGRLKKYGPIKFKDFKISDKELLKL